MPSDTKAERAKRPKKLASNGKKPKAKSKLGGGGLKTTDAEKKRKKRKKAMA